MWNQLCDLTFNLSHLSSSHINSEYNQAINLCSLETHCPTGAGDCQFPQSCWHGLTDCDVRDFTPFELGGFLNKPTQQELAEGMGLTYPSDDVSVCFYSLSLPLSLRRWLISWEFSRRIISFVDYIWRTSTKNAIHSRAPMEHLQTVIMVRLAIKTLSVMLE